MSLPSGAKTIIEHRRKGRKPDELILVSLIGPTGEPNFTVYADPKLEYDWRWSVDLKLCIYASEGRLWQPTAMAIARARPQWLGLWDADWHEGSDVWALPMVEDIEKPQTQWRYQLEFMPWLPTANRKFRHDN
jgi:hypothetical protein